MLLHAMHHIPVEKGEAAGHTKPAKSTRRSKATSLVRGDSQVGERFPKPDIRKWANSLEDSAVFSDGPRVAPDIRSKHLHLG